MVIIFSHQKRQITIKSEDTVMYPLTNENCVFSVNESLCKQVSTLKLTYMV